MSSELVSKREAARRLGVCIRTFDRYMATGMLPAYRLPGGHCRFKAADLEACLHRTDPAPKISSGPSYSYSPPAQSRRKIGEPLPDQPIMSTEEALQLAASATPEQRAKAEWRIRYMLAFPRRRRKPAGAKPGSGPARVKAPR